MQEGHINKLIILKLMCHIS